MDLATFFGPRPTNMALIANTLKGAREIRVYTNERRVMVTKRGQRVSARLPMVAEAEVLSLYDEGRIYSLPLPKSGRSSAALVVKH